MRDRPKTRLPSANEPHDRSQYALRATISCRDPARDAARHREADDRPRALAVSHQNRRPKSFQLSVRLDTISK